MSRALTVQNLYEKKFTTFPFTGVYAQVMGTPETSGIWLIYGGEKNGKTWTALLLAQYLSNFARTWYISAEEGTSKDFVDAARRAKIETTSRLHFSEYTPVEDVNSRLQSRKAPTVIVLDNATIYSDELKKSVLLNLVRRHPDKLFIIIAHEEKGAPYTALAKLARKLAKIIFHVQGLAAHVSGRCPGGKIIIDETKAALYWGNE